MKGIKEGMKLMIWLAVLSGDGSSTTSLLSLAQGDTDICGIKLPEICKSQQSLRYPLSPRQTYSMYFPHCQGT
jgi:hypothetical protein